MRLAGPGIRGRAAAALASVTAVCAAFAPVAALADRPSVTSAASALPASSDAPPTPVETRGLWVLRTSLTTPDSIAALVRSAREHRFNTLLVQVRARGDAYLQRVGRAAFAAAPAGPR